MSGSVRVLALLVAISFSAVMAACGGDDGPTNPGETPSISISLSGTSLNVTAGGSGQITVNVTRAGGFAGAVNVTADVPAGVTAAPVTIAAGSTSATMTFQVAAATAAGTLTATVRAGAQGVEQVTRPLSIVVVAAPVADFTLALGQAAATVQRGSTVTVPVTLTRTDFTGAVTLAATGLPQGVTASFDPAAPTTNASTLTLTAATGATLGAAAVNVTGTATGVTGTKTAPLALTVSAPANGGGTGNAVWSFCGDTGIPTWFAFQDGDGPWTRVTGDAQNVYRFQIDSDRGGMAYVTEDGGISQTQVFYYSRTELLTYGELECGGVGGAKTVNGSVTGLGALETAFISLGSSSTTADGAGGSNFTLENVVDGPQDLVAARAQFNFQSLGLTPDRLIIRRNLDPANGSTLPPLNFATEGFDPASATVTVNGLGANESTALTGLFTTARGGLGAYFAGLLGDEAPTYWGIPTEELENGDLHYLQVSAFDFEGTGETPPVTRQVGVAFRQVQDRAVTLGPNLVTPTVTTLAGGANARIQAAWTLQPEYDRYVFLALVQNDASVTIGASDGYLGGGAAAELAVPDLSGVTGWNTTWGLASGRSTVWTVTGTGWQGPGVVNFPELADGTQFFSATRSGTITP